MKTKKHEKQDIKNMNIVDILDKSEINSLIIENSNDAIYILDHDEQKFLEVNPAFEKLTGYSRKELLDGNITPQDLVAKEDIDVYQSKVKNRLSLPAEIYELQILTKNKKQIPVALNVRMISCNNKNLVIGSARDISPIKKLQNELWQKMIETIAISNRLYALTEKIKKIPEMIPALLSITDEKELLTKIVEFLSSHRGIGYKYVSIYTLESTTPKLAASNKTQKIGFLTPFDSKISKITRKEIKPFINQNEAILLLETKNNVIGALEVHFDPEEIKLLQDNKVSLKGYQDIAETLAKIISILIENLRLHGILKEQAIKDKLTDLFNRRYFDNKLREEINRAQRHNRPLSLILADIDNFKDVNDSLGHPQGDVTLREIADLLKSNTREEDIVCRYGGDEIAIIMPETTFPDAVAKANKLRDLIKQYQFKNTLDTELPLHLTISMGVATYTKNMGIDGAGNLVKLADKALYTAKQEGKDHVKSLYNYPPPE